MLDDEKIRNRLARVEAVLWEGDVYRHMFAGMAPDRENVGGARWNPSGVAAIYTALIRETALAEADHRLRLETIPLRKDIRRTIYRVHVTLNAVVDLSDWTLLGELGIDQAMLEEVQKSSLRACQQVGGGVDWYEYDGLLVPSARGEGANLVIYPSNQKPGYSFEVLDTEELAWPKK